MGRVVDREAFVDAGAVARLRRRLHGHELLQLLTGRRRSRRRRVTETVGRSSRTICTIGTIVCLIHHRHTVKLIQPISLEDVALNSQWLPERARKPVSSNLIQVYLHCLLST